MISAWAKGSVFYPLAFLATTFGICAIIGAGRFWALFFGSDVSLPWAFSEYAFMSIGMFPLALYAGGQVAILLYPAYILVYLILSAFDVRSAMKVGAAGMIFLPIALYIVIGFDDGFLERPTLSSHTLSKEPFLVYLVVTGTLMFGGLIGGLVIAASRPSSLRTSRPA